MSATEIALRDEHPAGLSLSDGPDPATAVAYAARVSTQIAAVLTEGNGYKTIQGKKHVTIEGWQTLAAMTGHSIEIEWSRPMPDMASNDRGVMTWEARALVRDQHGRVVAAGESMADPTEPDADRKWARGGNYGVRSMASTRAMSRAASSRMRYIVQLAGFAGTPAEEIPDDSAAPSERKPTKRELIAWRQGEAERRAAEVGVTDFQSFFADLGVTHPDQLFAEAKWKKVTEALDKREADAAEALEGEVIEGQATLMPDEPMRDPA